MKNLLLTILSIISLLCFSQTTHTVYGGMSGNTFYFTPENLTIEQGDNVVWINDSGCHDVNGTTNSITNEPFNNPESFASDVTCEVGAVIFAYTFNVPGLYNYDCSVGSHAVNGMIGTISVNETEPECEDDNSLIEQYFGNFFISDCIALVNYLGSNYGYDLVTSCNWDGQPMTDFGGSTIGDICECTCSETQNTSVFDSQITEKEKYLFSINTHGLIIEKSKGKNIIFDVYDSGKVVKKVIIN